MEEEFFTQLFVQTWAKSLHSFDLQFRFVLLDLICLICSRYAVFAAFGQFADYERCFQIVVGFYVSDHSLLTADAKHKNFRCLSGY